MAAGRHRSGGSVSGGRAQTVSDLETALSPPSPEHYSLQLTDVVGTIGGSQDAFGGDFHGGLGGPRSHVQVLAPGLRGTFACTCTTVDFTGSHRARQGGRPAEIGGFRFHPWTLRYYFLGGLCTL